jgi:hypothetical protein
MVRWFQTNDDMAELPPFSRGMDPVTRLQIVAMGPGNYPHTRLYIPEHLVSDIPEVLKQAQELNPSIDPEALFRTIIRLGIAAVHRNNERHVPIRPSDLVHARAAKDEEETGRALPP